MSQIRRFGQLIRVRPESVAAYEQLHAEPWPAVIAAIRRANIRNYSIYRREGLLFAYYEYDGDDYEADMAAMAADPDVQAWWKLTDAMQEPFPERSEGAWWLDLPEIFHVD
jgi:L-rhamnose mutarotase